MSAPHDAAARVASRRSASDDSELWCEVLGPLRAWIGGDPVPLGGTRQRRLLAALLAHANEVVSADRLIDVLWGDAGPGEGASALAKVVYRLRAALAARGAGRALITQSPGYRLVIDADRIDAGRFAALVQEGQELLDTDPARALSVLDEALALWRGPAWVELADADIARPLVSRLDGLHAVALECRVEAMLGLGRYEVAIPELEQAIARHPLRERPRAQLMRALYLDGRHAEALSEYRAFRDYLAEEMGLEPSAELRALEADILRQRLAMRAPRRTPAPPAGGRLAGLAPFDETFIGRTTELARLDALLERTMHGDNAIIARLVGEPGVGKTALAQVFGRIAYSRGCAVVYTRCSPMLDLTDQLRDALGGSDAADLRGALDGFGARRPVVVILDDSDQAPKEVHTVLRELASGSAGQTLCLVVGRDEHGDEEPFATAADLRLTGLSRDEVGELLTVASGAPRSAELVESVWLDSRGVPAVVAAVGRQLHQLDINARAAAALARAERARERLDRAEDDIARDVLAGFELAQQAPEPPTRSGAASPGACPYKGLAPFQESDAEFFHGRERLVATLVTKLAVDRFLAVLGPSGSGKSSLVAAGLLPALAAGALPGSDRWQALRIRPGADPMSALRQALARLAQRTDGAGNLDLAAQAGRFERLVLVVDQFEEVFTACQDPDRRLEFLNLLTSAATDSSSRASVVIVVRADYYGACAEHAHLAHLIGRSQVLVPPMTAGELRRAVVAPANRAGLTVEEALIETVVNDAESRTGALPMISTALLETWAARTGAVLTLSDYLAAGGVRGAVARLAETAWDSFDEPQREIARRILLRLADPDGATSDVRRRARRDELLTDAADEQVLAVLIERRLVTAADDGVEVAHEALLREWPRLRDWLEEDRDGRRLHRELADAALRWEADGRDHGDLYRGVRLDAVREWLATHSHDANAVERQFIAASDDFEQATLRTSRRTTRRLRLLVAALAVLLVAAAAGGLIALNQRSTAQREALHADVNRLATLASTLSGDHRDLALLLGAAGYELQSSDQAAGALQTALMGTPPGLDRIIRYPSASTSPHLDTTGRLLAVPGANGVTVDNLDTGTVRTLPSPSARQFAVFSGDDRFVAAGGADGSVFVWNASTGKASGNPVVVGGGTVHAVFDPRHDDRLYAISSSGALTAWDRSDPQHPREIASFSGIAAFPTPGNAPDLTISPDGGIIAAGGQDINGQSIARTWDTRTRATLQDVAGAIGPLAADGVTLPVGHLGDTELVNARTGRIAGTVPNTGVAPKSTISPDGSRLAVAQQHGSVNSLAVYDVTSHGRVGLPLTLRGTTLSPVGFLPDGRLLATSADEASIWTIGNDLPPLGVALDTTKDLSGYTSFPAETPVFVPGAREVLTIGAGAPLVHDAVTGRVTGTLRGGGVVPSPDGRLALGGAPGGVYIWAFGTDKQLGQLPGIPEEDLPYVSNMAWSPDGDRVAMTVAGVGYSWDVTDPAHPAAPVGIGDARLGVTQRLVFAGSDRIITVSQRGSRMSAIDLSSERTVWTRTVADIVGQPSPAGAQDVTVRQIAPSPDGTTIALDTGDLGSGVLSLLDAATGKGKASLAMPTSGGVGWLNHGRWLVVTFDAPDPQAQLYDATSLQSFGVPFPTADVDQYPVAVDSAGTRFAEDIESERNPPTGYDPLLWNVDPAGWVRTVCSIAGRNLTHAEWNQYLPDRPYRATCPTWPAGD